MRHSEADRKAFNENRIAEERRRVVAAWLASDPQIGALNNGDFYKIINGETVSVEPRFNMLGTIIGHVNV